MLVDLHCSWWLSSTDSAGSAACAFWVEHYCLDTPPLSPQQSSRQQASRVMCVVLCPVRSAGGALALHSC